MIWHPIETAPKDGTRILLHIKDFRIDCGQWNSDQYARKPKPYWDWGFPSKQIMRDDPPTHWMPLPEPPK